MTKEPIAYVAPEAYAFVRKDIEGLRALGVIVHDHYFNAQRALELPLAFVSQLLFLLKAKRHGVRHVVSHFAGYHSMLPALLGFRTHIIIAGADACSFPGIDYGSFRKTLMSAAMSYSMRHAETLLPVHQSLRQFKNTFSEFGQEDQGYSRFVKGLRTRELPLPYGFDAALWPLAETNIARNGALCVAMGASAGNAIHFRKGIDLIIEAARSLPSMRFTVIGSAEPASYFDLPENIRIHGRVSAAELRALYHAHSIYLQPSVMEGFPNALCEAMLCGCVPIVSDITSMPGIVGDEALVLHRRKPDLLIELLKRLDTLPSHTVEAMRTMSRERVLGITMDARMAELLRLVQANQGNDTNETRASGAIA